MHVHMYLHVVCVSKLMCLMGGGPSLVTWGASYRHEAENEILLAQAPAAAVTSWLPLGHHGIKEKDWNNSGCGPNESHPENTCAG
jgi:hypothetical protein